MFHYTRQVYRQDLKLILESSAFCGITVGAASTQQLQNGNDQHRHEGDRHAADATEGHRYHEVGPAAGAGQHAASRIVIAVVIRRQRTASQLGGRGGGFVPR